MTCVAALIDGGRVWMAGDSLCSVDDDTHYTDGQSKVWKRGEWIFGECGDARPTALLRHALELEEPEGGSLDRWMHTSFAKAVRRCFRQNGYEIVRSAEDDDDKTDFGLLIGVDGRLYHLDADLYVGRIKAPYYAVGSGGKVALGALGATAGSGYVPSQRLEMALELAERWCVGVRRPWTVVYT